MHTLFCYWETKTTHFILLMWSFIYNIHLDHINKMLKLFFQDCIMVIDGTLINVVIYTNKHVPYRGKEKGECTQYIVATCSFNMLFTHVFALLVGRAQHTSHTWWWMLFMIHTTISHMLLVNDSGIIQYNVFNMLFNSITFSNKYYIFYAEYSLIRSFFAPYQNICYRL